MLPERSCSLKEPSDDDREYHPVIFVTAKLEYNPQRQMWVYRKPTDLPKDARIIYVNERPTVCNQVTNFFKSLFQSNENNDYYAKENAKGLKK